LAPDLAVPDTNAPRVLVIDDDPVVRDSVQALLEYFGYECGIAADGPGGRKRFEEQTWDLVITDLTLPGMTGWRSSTPSVTAYQGCLCS
jgi:CheY-like chemotaxis protein